jgi:choline dehydrogenase-like flavoprotein
MFIDTRQLDDLSIIESEVCIVGGGVAGITLALELKKHAFRTCVIESGGFISDDATRDLYRGESIGLPYKFSDRCRSRFFGGSSNCWGGWCRPLEEEDFARREWVPNSGWPFTRSELGPYYERTRSILRLGPNRFDTNFWVNAIGNPAVRKIPFTTDRVADGISQFSPPVRFGSLYREELARSKQVTVYLYANAVDINIDDAQTVGVLKVRTLSGRRANVKAKVFVLAAGGIENARLLLVSNKVWPAGLGNHNDLVGRFFMDHPRLYSGRIRFREDWSRGKLYDFKYHYHNKELAAHGTCVAAQFGLAPYVQEREQLLNARICFSSVLPGEESKAAEALLRTRNRFQKQEQPGHSLMRDMLALLAEPIDATVFVLAHYLALRSLVKHFRFQAIVEPAPNPDSRVMLSQQRDQLGMNRVKVDWRLGSLVRRTFDRTLAIVAEELNRAGVADVVLDPPIENGEWPKTFEEEGCFHHMGTTRMHDSPTFGVVDRNCRVHGISNLYVAGSSVFPTAGGNFPTMTIVALALRLSDHLATKALRQPSLR